MQFHNTRRQLVKLLLADFVPVIVTSPDVGLVQEFEQFFFLLGFTGQQTGEVGTVTDGQVADDVEVVLLGTFAAKYQEDSFVGVFAGLV